MPNIRDDILAAAQTRRGLPYRLDPPPDGVNNIDCSLYVLKTLADAGVPLPGIRTAEQIRQATVPIAWDDVQPGDLLFFEGTYDAGPPSSDGHIASHIGISLGAGTGKMWDANEARGVGITTINPSPYWQPKLFEARRHPSLAGVVDDGNGVASGEQPRGIDVSSHQGVIDWPAVAASGIAFAFIKVTEDDGYFNPRFDHDWPSARQVGILRGAYHFARPEGGDAVQEADYFLDQIDARGGLLPGDMLALDLESGSGDLGQWALDFLHRCEQRAGFKPFVYTGGPFSREHGLGGAPALGSYPLWLAAYQDSRPPVPTPWSDIAIHQFTDSMTVPGITGKVDGNRYFGTIKELRALGKGGTVTIPSTTYIVGSGLLAMMTADGTTPIAPSTFLPLGQSPACIEEGYGSNGVIYRWFLTTGQSFRYRPAA